MSVKTLLLELEHRLKTVVSPTRFGQFLSIGALGAIVDTVVLVMLTSGVGIALLPAKLVSAEVAILLMFMINDRWTFAQWGEIGIIPLIKRALTSNAVRIGGVLIATGVLYLLVTVLGVWIVAANLMGIVVGFFANFVFESLLTWRVYDDRS